MAHYTISKFAHKTACRAGCGSLVTIDKGRTTARCPQCKAEHWKEIRKTDKAYQAYLESGMLPYRNVSTGITQFLTPEQLLIEAECWVPA